MPALEESMTACTPLVAALSALRPHGTKRTRTAKRICRPSADPTIRQLMARRSVDMAMASPTGTTIPPIPQSTSPIGSSSPRAHEIGAVTISALPLLYSYMCSITIDP